MDSGNLLLVSFVRITTSLRRPYVGVPMIREAYSSFLLYFVTGLNMNLSSV